MDSRTTGDQDFDGNGPTQSQYGMPNGMASRRNTPTVSPSSLAHVGTAARYFMRLTRATLIPEIVP
jgi:hypothetical protein